MAMNAEGLAGEMVAALQGAGFDTANEHAKTAEMCQALAAAVVAHIQANATANDPGGTSPGQHPIT